MKVLRSDLIDRFTNEHKKQEEKINKELAIKHDLEMKAQRDNNELLQKQQIDSTKQLLSHDEQKRKADESISSTTTSKSKRSRLSEVSSELQCASSISSVSNSSPERQPEVTGHVKQSLPSGRRHYNSSHQNDQPLSNIPEFTNNVLKKQQKSLSKNKSQERERQKKYT